MTEGEGNRIAIEENIVIAAEEGSRMFACKASDVVQALLVL